MATIGAAVAVAVLATGPGGDPRSTARAWGPGGHVLVNELAIELLPKEMRPLFEARRDEIARLANEPDERKGKDPKEGPRHYVDLDIEGTRPREYPRQYADVVKRFGEEKAYKYGVLPWWIGELEGELVSAMKAKDAERVVRTAGLLGHYVGDAHVPLHAITNYDGQLTGQKGIHAAWEHLMLDRFPFDERVRARLARSEVRLAEVEDPVAWTFERLYESYDLAARLLGADPGPKAEDRVLVLHEKTADIAEQRLAEAAIGLASLWYSAWVTAGKPALPE